MGADLQALGVESQPARPGECKAGQLDRERRRIAADRYLQWCDFCAFGLLGRDPIIDPRGKAACCQPPPAGIDDDQQCRGDDDDVFLTNWTYPEVAMP